MSDHAPAPGPTPARRLIPRAWLHLGCLTIFLYSFVGVAPGQLPGIKQARERTWVEQAHQIDLALFSYATDNIQNNNAYPDGKSSTEVFQKLIDGGYVTDPGVFYINLPGKTKALAGQKLKPENVCFDVTAGLDSGSPDDLPLVFLTGYKVTYSPGSAAVPLGKPPAPGLPVAYKNNSSKFLGQGADGSIPNFIPANFDPQGKTYRQLTPDGPSP
jgi:hypothetical protein